MTSLRTLAPFILCSACAAPSETVPKLRAHLTGAIVEDDGQLVHVRAIAEVEAGDEPVAHAWTLGVLQNDVDGALLEQKLLGPLEGVIAGEPDARLRLELMAHEARTVTFEATLTSQKDGAGPRYFACGEPVGVVVLLDGTTNAWASEGFATNVVCD